VVEELTTVRRGSLNRRGRDVDMADEASGGSQRNPAAVRALLAFIVAFLGGTGPPMRHSRAVSAMKRISPPIGASRITAR
jgi:hypothetical protein